MIGLSHIHKDWGTPDESDVNLLKEAYAKICKIHKIPIEYPPESLITHYAGYIHDMEKWIDKPCKFCGEMWNHLPPEEKCQNTRRAEWMLVHKGEEPDF